MQLSERLKPELWFLVTLNRGDIAGWEGKRIKKWTIMDEDHHQFLHFNERLD
jgi:hypothetical protein